jgi:hypothetical protein
MLLVYKCPRGHLYRDTRPPAGAACPLCGLGLTMTTTTENEIRAEMAEQLARLRPPATR